MGSQTKIVVVKAKELIYTGIFLVLGILFVILLITMFGKDKNKDSASTQKYIPGVYSSTITLGENTLNVSVAVDEDTISGVSIENLNETVTTMYPLLEPALNEINSQISVVEVHRLAYFIFHHQLHCFCRSFITFFHQRFFLF